MIVLLLAVSALCWLALAKRGARLALATLLLVAVGLKIVYWGYYVPEWNYRYSQGPWARAIAQWIPRKWTLYTLHEWPADLAFFTKRTVRQLPSPEYLKYQEGESCKFVLLLPSEFENWPSSAPPVTWWRDFRTKRRVNGSWPELRGRFRCRPAGTTRGFHSFARPDCLRPALPSLVEGEAVNAAAEVLDAASR